MGNVKRYALTLLLLVGSMLASPCNQMVYDGANVLGAMSAGVTNAAGPLTEQGADVHIITVSSLGSSSLDQVIAEIGRQCDSWKSANGGVKANMLVFAVSPKDRKMGIFYGPGYKSALDGQANRIKRDYMAPHFKGGDWAYGFISAEEQVTKRIKSSTDESNKPVVNETINQASQPMNLTGLWIFLGLIGLGGISFMLFKILEERKRTRQRVLAAQQGAVAARSSVTSMLSELRDRITGFVDLVANPGAKAADDIIDYVTVQFTRMNDSISSDPTQDGGSESFYNSLASQYEKLSARLEVAKKCLSNPEKDPLSHTDSTPFEASTLIKAKGKKSTHTKYTGRPVFKRPVPNSTSPAPVVQEQVNNNNNNDLMTGIVLGEVLSEHRHDDLPDQGDQSDHERRSKSSFSDNQSSSSTPSNDNDSWSGSSSSTDSNSDSSSILDGVSSAFDSIADSFGGSSDSF